jgi:hypothetical protein
LVQFNSLKNVWQSFKINYRKIASRFANSTLFQKSRKSQN